MFKKYHPQRSIPICQIEDQSVLFVNQYSPRLKLRNNFKRLCFLTGRGRSVTRTTGLSRSMFRMSLLKGWCWGIQRSSW